jgi:hypothetical protein
MRHTQLLEAGRLQRNEAEFPRKRKGGRISSPSFEFKTRGSERIAKLELDLTTAVPRLCVISEVGAIS